MASLGQDREPLSEQHRDRRKTTARTPRRKDQDELNKCGRRLHRQARATLMRHEFLPRVNSPDFMHDEVQAAIVKHRTAGALWIRLTDVGNGIWVESLFEAPEIEPPFDPPMTIAYNPERT